MPCLQKCKECLQYDTVKLVRIKSFKLGILHHVIQIGIFAYIIVYAIVLQKGYQKGVIGFGDAEVKVKGAAWSTDPTAVPYVWDASDLVMPSVESDAVFIATSAVANTGQYQGVCVLPGVSGSACPGNQTKYGKPVNCNSTSSDDYDCCFEGWCPAATIDVTTQAPLENAMNLNVTIRFNGYFSEGDANFNANLTTSITLTLEQISQFLPPTNGVPGFRQGGEVLLGNVEWVCDLDYSFPAYSNNASLSYGAPGEPGCTLTPDSFGTQTGKISCGPCWMNITFARLLDQSNQGFSIKSSDTYMNGNQLQRNLLQFAGIRILFYIDITGGKFNIGSLLVNLGSGLALMSLATVLADILAIYCLRRRDYYREMKYHEVEDASSDEGRSPSQRSKVQSALNKRKLASVNSYGSSKYDDYN